MTAKTFLLAVAAFAAVGAAGGAALPALAQADSTSRAVAKAPLAQAVAAAEQTVGGRAFDAELDHERGALVYEIDLVKNGRAVEARVDAATGKVIHQQTLGAARLPFTSEHLKAAQAAPRTLSQTIALIESSTKGQVTDIGLEREAGRYYYEAELAGAQDREVRVDLRTGALTPVMDD